jgi:hypothetical protein
MQNVLRSKKGQGTTEYIVILALAVLFLVGVFWGRIRPILQGKVGDLATNIQNAR